MKNDYEKLLSPCIISKVKPSFGLKNRYRFNSTRCSSHKWAEICNLIGSKHQKSKNEISLAIEKYSIYINL